MSFWRGLLTARSHVAFMAGLAGALLAIWRVEANMPPPPAPVRAGVEDFAKVLLTKNQPGLRPRAPLDDQDQIAAHSAWKYFENNLQVKTGLVNSVDKFPSTTLWDLGSYLMGLLAAKDLGIVDEPAFEGRLAPLLVSLAQIQLVEGLPNKVYDTRTLKMVDYSNAETPAGIGWSAIDIARLAVPLNLVAWRYPVHTPAVRAILGRWQLGALVEKGRLIGGNRDKTGKLEHLQEGRFGYEQYAAKSLFLLGSDVSAAIRYDVDVEVMKVEGQLVAYDRRLPGDHNGTHNAVLSEPYILEGLEFGLDATTLPLARAVFAAQERRAEKVGRLVAVSEDNLDRTPYFVYNTVLNDRTPWAAFSPDGKDAANFRTLSTKAALGWSFLFDGVYSGKLRAAGTALGNPAAGFYSGRYDRDGQVNKALTANTNGIILEALWYKERGPLLREARQK